MVKQVQVRIVLEVAVDDPGAVSDAACAMYAAMDTSPPGGDPLPATLERNLRELPGLALQTLLNPSELLDHIPGVTMISGELMVEPHSL